MFRIAINTIGHGGGWLDDTTKLQVAGSNPTTDGFSLKKGHFLVFSYNTPYKVPYVRAWDSRLNCQLELRIEQ